MELLKALKIMKYCCHLYTMQHLLKKAESSSNLTT